MTSRKRRSIWNRKVSLRFSPAKVALLGSFALLAFFMFHEPGSALALIGTIEAELI